MTQGQRQRQILEILDIKGELLVEEACKILSASPATIRRDFNELVELDKAEKTWGGIMKKLAPEKHFSDSMLPLSQRKEHQTKEKKAIAAYASRMIEPGDVVMIDGGSTTWFMAPFIADMPIKVITNSIIIASYIDQVRTSKNGADVFLTGGMLYPESGLLVGPHSNSGIRNYFAKYAFLSAGALDENGPSNSNQLVVESEQIMIAQSKQAILLADHTKFNKRDMCSMCSWDPISFTITDVFSKVPRIIENKTILVEV